MLVKDLMTSPAHAVSPSTPVSAVQKLFEERRLHHVPVLDGDDLIGIITPRDVEMLGFGVDLDPDLPMGRLADYLYSAKDAMSGWPACIGEEQTVERAAEMLSTGAFHALPVLDKDGVLVGMLTSTDLVRYLAETLSAGAAA